MIGKTWRKIEGFPKYMVSDNGDIRSLDYNHTGRSKILKPQKWGGRYPTVVLSKDGKSYTKTVHRIVAEAFVPNPENKPVINHKNGDKTDNKASNLEWATISENTKHAYTSGLFVNPRKKAIICLETGAIYSDSYAAAKDTGAYQGNITKCCLGRYRQTAKLHFVYVNNNVYNAS